MGIKRSQVPPALRDEIDKGKDQGSRDAAVRYVANVQDQILRPPKKAKATTTTTAPKATTTTRPRPKPSVTTAAPATP